MRPGDRLICAFVDHFDQGDRFKDWPLHVTVVPWFRTEFSSDKLADELCDRLCSHKSFQVVMSDETQLGRGKTVNLVARPTPLMEIEEQVRVVVKRNDAWLIDETTKRHREFRPHVTAQKDIRLYRGDTFICNAFYVIEQKGDHKEVVARVNLAPI